jgi:hypothetical protein
MAVAERRRHVVVHLNHVQEARLGTWLFAALAFVVFIAGFVIIGRADLHTVELIAAVIGVLTLTLVCAGLSTLCHLMVDLFEDLHVGKGEPTGS